MVKSITHVEKSRLGGLRRIQLYGNLGTPEGRSKGGKKTISFFHQNPLLAQRAGFVIRKEIRCPKRSPELAEFIGIMLGDGSLPGNHQLSITFNIKTDYEYAKYICKLLSELFAVSYHMRRRKDNNGADILVSSSNLVDFLLKEGLVAGNKVKNQVGVPSWICEDSRYRKACLRGLMDTDGGLYLHRYNSNGKNYEYLKLGFTNCSKPLLNFVFNTLRKLNYKAYLTGNNVSIYSMPEVKRYLTETGTHNPKNIKKFKSYFVN